MIYSLYSRHSLAKLVYLYQGGTNYMSVPFGFEEAAPQVYAETHRLGPLPIIRHFLDRLEVRKFVDELSPKPDSAVTNGECVEALVMSIFLDKEHALSRVRSVLSGYDLPSVFRPDMSVVHFHDTRLGECLDDLYIHAPTIYGDIVAKAIREFHVTIRRLNLDISKLLLHGEYHCDEDYLDHADSIVFPERGYNPEGRWDLKQLLLQLLVSEECIPLLYRHGNGNASETHEYLELLKKLDTIQADISKAVLLADCKMCSAVTLLEAAEQQLRLVTLVPESFSLQGELIEMASREDDLPVLRVSGTPGEDDWVEYRGKSYRIHLLIDVKSGGTRRTKDTWWRYLVVFSSAKAKQAQEKRKEEKQDERKSLEVDLARYSKEQLFACQADAEKEAKGWIKKKKLRYHQVAVQKVEEKVKRGRGKPRKEGLKPSDQVGWGVSFVIEELPQPVFKYDPEGMFVLLSTVTDNRILTDQEILDGYKGRNVVEMSFHWLKGDAAVCPMWLNLPSRIQTMGFIFVLWALIYGLIQRELRIALKAKGGTCPHPDRRNTDRPTTRGVLDTLVHISITRIHYPGGIKEQINGLDQRHERILDLLGASHLYRPNSRGAP